MFPIREECPYREQGFPNIQKNVFLLYQRSKNTYLHHCNCPFQSFCCLESLEISKIARFQIEREFSQKFLTRTSLKQLGKKFVKGIPNLKHVSKISNSSLNTSRAFSNVKDRSEAKSKERKKYFPKEVIEKKSKGLRSHSNKSYYYKEGCL